MPVSPQHATRRTTFHTLLVFRAPTTLSEAIAERASQRGVSMSAFIREAIEGRLRTSHETPDAGYGATTRRASAEERAQ